MEFVFKPEKLTEELVDQVAEAVGKRAEIFSREKLPGMWKKVDKLNEKKMPEEVLRHRKIRYVIYGIILIAVGFFLFIPGLMKPKELTVPLIVGAFSIINGIFAVLPRRTNAEKFKKKAEKLVSAINSSLLAKKKFLKTAQRLWNMKTLKVLSKTGVFFLFATETK